MRILLGEISSYKAIVIARYIRAVYPNVELWAYDKQSIIHVMHTKYVRKCIHIPFQSIECYINSLARYVNTQEIDMLLPVHSDYMGIILQHKELFGHALDWIGTYDDYIRLHEKSLLMNLASTLDIRVPRTYHSPQEARVPFVIKPTNLSSAKGVHYYQTEKEKKTINILPKDSICQEYIRGQGCGYEVYSREGKIIVEYGHIRYAEWPVSGGSSVLRGRYMHPRMRSIAEKILSEIRWTGYAMFEFKLTPDNELVLLEVNPRIWGSINQALQDGCPFLSPIIGSPIWSESNAEVRTCLVPQVWLSMIRYAMKGQLDIVQDYISHLSITSRDVNFWTDPRGLISMIIHKLL